MSLTQTVIAAHLDLDQSNVSRFLSKLEIDWRQTSLDEIRVLYIRQLREQAAGHRTADGTDLIQERILSERVDRELKQFTLAEKKGQLVNLDQLEPELMQMVGAFKSDLLTRDDKLKAELDALYGIDVDVQLLNDHTHGAFTHLSRYDPSSACAAGAPVPVDEAG